MNDSEVREIVLKLFYEKRTENFIPINEKNFGNQFPISEIYRICSQLKDLGYIDFKAQYADNQIYSAWGKILVFGTDYVEQMHSKTKESDFVSNAATNSLKPPIAQINITGDVTDSTILIGNENRLTTTTITHQRQLEMPTDKGEETATLSDARRADDRDQRPSEANPVQ